MELFVISGLVAAFLSNVVVGIWRLFHIGRQQRDRTTKDVTLDTRIIKDIAIQTKTINSKEVDDMLLIALSQLKKDAAENKRVFHDGEFLKDKSNDAPVNSRGLTYEK